MNVKNVEKENGSAKVTVEIAKDEFQTALDKAYAKIRKDIMIPGFRKGKAPRKFVERMYGSQVFYEDAVSEIFPDIYEAAIVKQELKAVGQPSVTDMQTPEDGSVVLTVSTELYPEVTLGEYKGIEVPKREVKVEESEVDAEVNRMAERNARIETVDRAAQMGDTVVIDFEGFEGGKPFQGGKAEDYSLTLGSGSFIPGFEEALVGAVAGEERDVNVTFPENYAKELAGKPAVFKIKLIDVCVRQLPALNSDFAKKAGKVDTMEAFREQIRQQIHDGKHASALNRAKDQVLTQLANAAEGEIPSVLVESTYQQEMQNVQQQLQMQRLSLDRYLSQIHETRESFTAKVRSSAEKTARVHMALLQIAQQENLLPTEVAGCPPDGFSATGQLWGNPLYDWAAMEKDGYGWWLSRLGHALTTYDAVRIDHFRAFASYWAVDAQAETAKVGQWLPGPGMKLFDKVFEVYPNAPIIAEDLGVFGEDVVQLLADTGFPGMKVFQFAFDGRSDNEHLPENVKYNTVYYTGTHDNDTLKGWYDAQGDGTKEYVKKTLGATDENVFDKVFKKVMRSRAKFVIVPMQDYLLQGSEARMNTPGTNDGNWKYVLPKNYAKVKNRIRKYVRNRCSDLSLIHI